MHVLTWDQKRKKLLRQLAGLDAAVARRVVDLESAWAETERQHASASTATQALAIEGIEALQEYSTAEDLLLQPKPPELIDMPPDPDEMHVPAATETVSMPPPATPPKQKSLASYLE